MSEHLVEQLTSPQAVHLTCHACDWYAEIGRKHLLDHDTLLKIAPVALAVKWSHEHPDAFDLTFDPAEAVDLTIWRRVRNYLARGDS
jgi:hypothetical protein